MHVRVLLARYREYAPLPVVPGRGVAPERDRALVSGRRQESRGVGARALGRATRAR